MGMLVQVRCMHVSSPSSEWAVLTNAVVASEVAPPAPQLQSKRVEKNVVSSPARLSFSSPQRVQRANPIAPRFLVPQFFFLVLPPAHGV
jgi:hypothetical protein